MISPDVNIVSWATCPKHIFLSFLWTEFIQLLSSEANEIATKEKKNTIQPEHVMSALKELGFEGELGGVASYFLPTNS